MLNKNQPPRRFPCVQPLYHETYLQALARQKHLTDHWRRVDYAKSMIDNGPPHMVANVRMKLKQILCEGERLARIEKDNRHLLYQILHVMRAPAGVDHYHKRPLQKRTSLNYEERKLFVRKINRENKAMLQRIIDCRPAYDHVELEIDYQRMTGICHKTTRAQIFKNWNETLAQRRRQIMCRKTENTFCGRNIDREELGRRMAETHRNCFPKESSPTRPAPIPKSCISAPGTNPVDHGRCFVAPPLLPPIRKKKYKLQPPPENKTNPRAKERDVNQSASSAFTGSVPESIKDSPYQTALNLDRLAHVALPPIPKATTSDHKRQEASCKIVKEPEKVHLPKIPLPKPRKKGPGCRKCAMRAADTSISLPRRDLDISSESARRKREKGEQEQTAHPSTTVTVSDNIISKACARRVQRLRVTVQAYANKRKVPPKPGKICSTAQKFADIETTLNCTDVSEETTCNAGSLGKTSSTMKSLRGRHQSDTSDASSSKEPEDVASVGTGTKRRHESQDSGEPSVPADLMAGERNRSQVGTVGYPDQQNSANQSTRKSRTDLQGDGPECLQSKRSHRKHSPGNVEDDGQAKPHSPVSGVPWMLEDSKQDNLTKSPSSEDPSESGSLDTNNKSQDESEENEQSSREAEDPCPRTPAGNNGPGAPESTSQPNFPTSETPAVWDTPSTSDLSGESQA